MPADGGVANLRRAFVAIPDPRVELLGRLVNGPYVVDHYRTSMGGGFWQSAAVARQSP